MSATIKPAGQRARRGQDARVRRGFTLIEILMVVLFIAILATIAASRFGESKRRGYITAMKSDLRNVALIAESVYATDGSYESLPVPSTSAGVTVTVSAQPTEWSATAVHVNVPGLICHITSAVRGPNDPPMPYCD